MVNSSIMALFLIGLIFVLIHSGVEAQQLSGNAQSNEQKTSVDKFVVAEEPAFPDEKGQNLAAAFRSRVNNQDWYCQQEDHTMCIWQEGVFGPKCTAHPRVEPTDPEEVLQAHNKWRRKVAKGEERRGSPGPQPSASNMRRLEWDEELAKIALRFAHQCQGGHDKMRNVQRFSVGQNTAQSNVRTSYGDPAETDMGKLDWDGVVKRLHDEVALFSKHHVQSGLHSGLPMSYRKSVGHYTQLVWADTYLVGCAAVRWYRDSSKTQTDIFYVCNYGPTGNYENVPLYKIGEACSACPSDFPICQDGLCARQEKTGGETEPVKPPAEEKEKFVPWRSDSRRKNKNGQIPAKRKPSKQIELAPDSKEKSVEYDTENEKVANKLETKLPKQKVKLHFAPKPTALDEGGNELTKMPVIDNKGFELARPFLEETSQALMQSFMEAWQNKMSDTKITPDDEGTKIVIKGPSATDEGYALVHPYLQETPQTHIQPMVKPLLQLIMERLQNMEHNRKPISEPGSGNQKKVEKVNGFESPPVAETPGQLQTSPEVEEGMPNFYSQEQLLPATYRSIAIPTAEDLRYILDFFKTFLELLQIFF